MDHEVKKLLKNNLLEIPSSDFTARTMLKIHEVGAGKPAGRKISRWTLLSPLIACTILALLLTFLLPWGVPGAISWADVQKQIELVHSMTARSYYEFTTPGRERIWFTMKTYVKDPGLRRSEIYDMADDLQTLKPEPQWISILKNDPGRSSGLTLHPDSRWAEMWTEVSHAYGLEPSTQLIGRNYPQESLNYALEQWNQISKITADKARRIGARVIDGRPAVGFSFEVSSRVLDLGDWAPEKVPGKIWVGRDDGVPMLVELEYMMGYGGHKVRFVTLDIEWNVPIDDRLFDQTVPAGWGLSRHLEDSIEFAGIDFRPDVSLEIGPEGQAPFATARDVAGLVKTERTTQPDRDPACTGSVTIELKAGAAKRLRDYAEAYPDNPLVVDFNGEMEAEVKLDSANPARLSFDITPICLSMFRLEEKYTTAAIRKNTS